MEELVESLFDHEDINDWSFCTFRPNHAVNECICYPKVQQALDDYLHSTHTDNMDLSKIYGISIHDVLIRSIQAFIDDENSSNRTWIFVHFVCYGNTKKCYESI